MIGTLQLRIVLLAFAWGGLASCAQLVQFKMGDAFSPQTIETLQLGKTTETDFQRIFGKEPLLKETQETLEGKTIRLITYQYTESKWGKILVRLVTAEFQNQLLNGYLWMSNFPSDDPQTDLLKSEEIRKGTTTQNDILQLLGEPKGYARAPTYLREPIPSFETVEDISMQKPSEVWYYTNITSSYTGMADVESEVSVLSISFDQKGVVQATQLVSSRET